MWSDFQYENRDRMATPGNDMGQGASMPPQSQPQNTQLRRPLGFGQLDSLSQYASPQRPPSFGQTPPVQQAIMRDPMGGPFNNQNAQDLYGQMSAFLKDPRARVRLQGAHIAGDFMNSANTTYGNVMNTDNANRIHSANSVNLATTLQRDTQTRTLPDTQYPYRTNYAAGTTRVPGTDHGDDTFPAMLRPGEAVLTPGAAEELGRGRIEALNSRHAPPRGLQRAQGPVPHYGIGSAFTGTLNWVKNAAGRGWNAVREYGAPAAGAAGAAAASVADGSPGSGWTEVEPGAWQSTPEFPASTPKSRANIEMPSVWANPPGKRPKPSNAPRDWRPFMSEAPPGTPPPQPTPPPKDAAYLYDEPYTERAPRRSDNSSLGGYNAPDKPLGRRILGGAGAAMNAMLGVDAARELYGGVSRAVDADNPYAAAGEVGQGVVNSAVDAAALGKGRVAKTAATAMLGKLGLEGLGVDSFTNLPRQAIGAAAYGVDKLLANYGPPVLSSRAAPRVAAFETPQVLPMNPADVEAELRATGRYTPQRLKEALGHFNTAPSMGVTGTGTPVAHIAPTTLRGGAHATDSSQMPEDYYTPTPTGYGGLNIADLGHTPRIVKLSDGTVTGISAHRDDNNHLVLSGDSNSYGEAHGIDPALVRAQGGPPSYEEALQRQHLKNIHDMNDPNPHVREAAQHSENALVGIEGAHAQRYTANIGAQAHVYGYDKDLAVNMARMTREFADKQLERFNKHVDSTLGPSTFKDGQDLNPERTAFENSLMQELGERRINHLGYLPAAAFSQIMGDFATQRKLEDANSLVPRLFNKYFGTGENTVGGPMSGWRRGGVKLDKHPITGQTTVETPGQGSTRYTAVNGGGFFASPEDVQIRRALTGPQ